MVIAQCHPVLTPGVFPRNFVPRLFERKFNLKMKKKRNHSETPSENIHSK